MISIKQFSRAIFSIIVAIFIFLLLYEGLSYVKHLEHYASSNDIEISNEIAENEKSPEQILKEAGAFFDAVENEEWNSVLQENIVQSTRIMTTNQDVAYVAFHDLSHSHPVVFIIYFLLCTALSVQLYFFFSVGQTPMDGRHAYAVIWAIETPMVMGVMGTLISYAIISHRSQEIDLLEIFNEHFYDAIMTTIIGASFYIINKALLIHIGPYIDFRLKQIDS